MSLVKIALGLTVAGGLAGAGYIMDKKGEKDAVAKYGLSTAQSAFMTACKSALSDGKKKFKNTSATEGCACIAGKLGSGLSEAEYRLAGEMMKAVVATHSSNDRMTFVRQMEAATKRSGLSEAQSLAVLRSYHQGADACLARA
jgi:hypothetical protein